MRKYIALGALALTVPAFADNHADMGDQAPEANAAAQLDAERAERMYHNAQQNYLSGLMTSDGWHTMEGGLRWRYVEYLGSEEKPTASDTVTVHYEGTFIDGETFDSSFDRGTPATFGLSGLITAWEMAIPQMGVGDTIEIAAPSNLAYGPRGRGPIPGGATLLFKVQLISIRGR